MHALCALVHFHACNVEVYEYTSTYTDITLRGMVLFPHMCVDFDAVDCDDVTYSVAQTLCPVEYADFVANVCLRHSARSRLSIE